MDALPPSIYGEAMPPVRYHHGDLRSALIRVALALVEKDGESALTMRRVADGAGVSAMAAYHHFANRADLVAATAAAGFERLYTDKLAALAAHRDDPRAALIAGTVSYVAFVVANPALYRLMGSVERADAGRSADLAAAAAAPVASLSGLVRALAAAGGIGDADPGDVARQLWAFAHGLGHLVIEGYLAVDAGAAARLAGDGARALLNGLVRG